MMTTTMPNRLDAAKDIDWTSAFVWVQDYTRIQLVGGPDRDGRKTYLSTKGRVFQLSDAELNAQFFPNDLPGDYKRHYDPVKGHCLAEPAIVTVDGVDHALERGDAVLRWPDGRLAVMKGEEYREKFLAIAFGTPAEAPPYPFPSDSEPWQGW